MKTYNGFRSWNAWNVALWMNNDSTWMRTIDRLCVQSRTINEAMEIFMDEYKKTPDGAIVNKMSIKDIFEQLWGDFRRDRVRYRLYKKFER